MKTETTMMMRTLVVAALVARLAAADEPPLMRPEDRMELGRQAVELFDAARPAVRAASASTVWVYADRRPVALGTVIGGDGSRVLTKWSEVAFARRGIHCMSADGKTFAARMVGVYADDDLAVLSLEPDKLKPVSWSTAPSPGAGRFVVAALPDARVGGFGVVGVGERSLRESDQAYLGVMGDPSYHGGGVRVMEVSQNSGAEAAGIRQGDILRKVGDRPVNGVLELRNSLLEIKPGARVDMLVSRGGKEMQVTVTVGNRPKIQQFPQARLRQMEQMGGEISRMRDGFPDVIESDIKLDPGLCGGPMVDLEGRVVGISVARASRTKSYFIPAARVVELLKQEPSAAAMARAAIAEQGVPQLQGRPARIDPGSAERMRRRFEEMRRLMELFDREMRQMEEGR